MRKTSIIILTYNNLSLTKKCIESIFKYTEKDTYEIIVVDNASTDDTVSYLKEQKNIKTVFNSENVGFPRGCNIGIQLASKDNDILLLNNDTIVTTNGLKNLKICLESDEKIGAVGAISNNNDNLQGCDFSYNNFDEMQILAEKNNVSDPKKWERKVCLIGFCLLIKGAVLEKLGGLDENYSPGYIEDNDLSLRIIDLGYDLVLCHDAFIHHYLGTAFRKDQEKFNQLILKNRAYFEQKWKFDVFTFDKTKYLSTFLASNAQHILDYNCEIGASSLHIKYSFEKANVIGIEKNEEKAKIACKYIPVVSSLDKLKNQKFDTIFIGNALETEDNPLWFLYDLKKILTENGKIIGEVKNLSFIDNLKLLIDETWYYTNFQKQNYFTKKDLLKLFESLGFKKQTIHSYKRELIEEEKELLNRLNKPDLEADTYYYAFCFVK